jgi:E3 ubiquitin-protein ligase RNF115/126
MLFHFVTFTHFVPDPFYLLLLQELAAAGSNRENQGAPPASEKEMFLIKQYQLLSDEHKGEDPCSICQEVFCKGEYVSEMPCNHKFHKSCLDGWIGIHNTCPICRKSLAEN